MGLCVDANETKHGVTFEIRRESVVLFDDDGERVEVTKSFLAKLTGLLNDPEWRERLTKTSRELKL